MIFVPLPFVVALLLVILLVRMVRQNDWAEHAKRPFLLLIGAYTLQSIIIGIRWGYEVLDILPVQPVVACMIAALAWISFRNLASERQISLLRFWPHILPSVLIVALLIFWRDPVGPAVTATFLAYGAALLWLARNGPDALVSSRLDGALLSYRSLVITGLALIASSVADIAISLDLEQSGGIHAGAIVAVGNVITLLILGTAASIASGSQSLAAPTSEAAAPPAPSQEDDTIARALESLMQSRQIYRDADLNLGRIARKMNLPARRVSMAVNRVHGTSVSQYVNDYRIRAACDALTNTDEPVTRLMFDCGFISKSNFNREFLRVTGTNPTEFRRRGNHKPEASDTRPTLFVSR